MVKMCGMCCVKQYKTSKSHHVKTKGASVYDVNTKATGAMVHSGLSVTEMQKFTVSL